MRNYNSNLPEKTNIISKKLFRLIIFVVYPINAIQSLIVSPIYTITKSNVVYSVLPVIFKFLITAIDIFVIYFSLAIIIYGLCKTDFSEMKKTIAFVLISPYFKYILKMAISPFVDGIPSKDQLFLDVYSLLLSGTLELLQFLIVVLISYKSIKRYKEKCLIVEKAKQKIDDKHLPDMSLLPFKKIVSFNNPLQCGAIISLAFVTIIRILMLLYSDIMNYSAFPDNFGDIVLFFGAYFAEIIIGIVGYLIMLYTYISISQNENK